jgi:hypothetical protein
MRIARGVLLALLAVSLGGPLAGCESMENFQFWDTKKKLPGERKPVFPAGVPGVEQGIPPELVKGYQEQPAVDPAAQAAQETADKVQPKKPQKAEAKPKPKPKVAKVAPPASAPEQAQPAAQAGWPAQQPPPPPQAQQQPAPWPTAR